MAIPRYQVMLVERIPQSASAPTLTVVDEIIPHEKLSWGETLDGLGHITYSISPDEQSAEVKSRLIDISAQGLETWLYRDSDLVAAGPLIGMQPQGETHVIINRALTYYLRYMHVTSDLSYPSTDQYTIAKNLVDHWQGLTYGNFGIDTTGIGTSGTTRDADFPASEAKNIFKAIAELADADFGFEFYVDPTTRDLVLTSRRGADKSSGTGAVILDERNITSPNAYFSVGQGDFATHAIAVGANVDTDTPVVGVVSGGTPMTNWGRAGFVIGVDGVTQQATIDEYAQNLYNALSHMLFSPSPTGQGGGESGGAGSILPSIDVDPFSIEVGDTILWSYDYGYGVAELTRDVWAKTITVAPDGTEGLNLGFV